MANDAIILTTRSWRWWYVWRHQHWNWTHFQSIFHSCLADLAVLEGHSSSVDSTTQLTPKSQRKKCTDQLNCIALPIGHMILLKSKAGHLSQCAFGLHKCTTQFPLVLSSNSMTRRCTSYFHLSSYQLVISQINFKSKMRGNDTAVILLRIDVIEIAFER